MSDRPTLLFQSRFAFRLALEKFFNLIRTASIRTRRLPPATSFPRLTAAGAGQIPSSPEHTSLSPARVGGPLSCSEDVHHWGTIATARFHLTLLLRIKWSCVRIPPLPKVTTIGYISGFASCIPLESLDR